MEREDAGRQSEAMWLALGATVAIELVCVVLRFGRGLESTVETASTIGRFTLGYRIHHGYIGLLLIPMAYWWRGRSPELARWMWIAGVSLAASDAIHHFLVLWPITGSPDFDWVYPST